jgi:tRNA-dihydrouridine synthase B
MVRIGPVELGEFPLLLAPMEDVSDPPFRALCKEHGADMMYTEFISSEGLMRRAAEISAASGPDVLDINYGCPVKKVACKGAGAGILQDIPKMVSMTKEIVEAVDLPVTVKTRLGWDDSTKYIVEVAERLQDVGIQAISIHGRTRAQMYKGQADWSLIRAVRENPRMSIPVFGNGDIDTPEKALAYRQEYGVDGIMIGRASIGNPWIFNQIKHFFATGEHLPPPSISDRVEAARQHLDQSLSWKGPRLGVVEMRRHYANYFRGLPHFKEHRLTLVTEEDPTLLHARLDAISEAYRGHTHPA